MPTPADRNLLFGILALQMDFISRDALIEAMHTWVLKKNKQLGEILLNQKALKPDTNDLLEALVDKHLEMHGNDPEKSLISVSSIGSLRDDLHKIADQELEASLAHVSIGHKEDDPYATRPFAAGEQTSAGLRFRILRPHAKGGLGEVFVAEDAELHREVALKEIQGQYADNPQARSRFLLEAEITGGLEHPGIVPVYGLGQYGDGRPFYAMRFIKGDNLKDAIERFHRSEGPKRDPGETVLEFRKLLRRFQDVCNAVAYAHSRGVLHRDLKPGNIMLGQFGETLVVDWGLAKTTEENDPEASAPDSPVRPTLGRGSEPTRMGTAIGSPQYMSPEQASGRIDQLGPRSDVYGLGATLYCLLTGMPPFSGTDIGDLLRKVRQGQTSAPREMKHDVPAALDAICRKAMALSPLDRYGSPADLSDDLEHWLADEAVSAQIDPWPAKLGRWTRHHKGLVGSITAIWLLLIATVVAAGFWDRAQKMEKLRDDANEQRRLADDQRGTAEEQRAFAQEQREIAEQQRSRAKEQESLVRRLLYFSRINMADRAWHEAQIGPMLDLLEGLSPSKPGQEDLRGLEWNYLWRLAHADLFTLKGHTSIVSSVAFSPDGQRLASGSHDNTVKIWDARTGQESLTLKGHTEAVMCVAFSPDGQRLASGSNDNTVKIWDVRTGQESLTFKCKLTSGITFSPDGQRVATADLILKDRVVDSVVKIWDARTGQEILTLKGHTSIVSSVGFSPDGLRLATGGWDRTVKIWDARTGQESLTLKGHTEAVMCVAFSPDGQRLASGSYDKTVKIWDARTGQESLTLKGHTSIVSSVAFSPDGQRLASGSRDNTVKIWDTRTGQESLTLKGHTGLGRAEGFNPKIWDWRTGQEMTLKGHTSNALSVAFSPDGQRLATADTTVKDSLGSVVKIWDARTGQEILTLKGHTGLVNSVAFSPDGQRLASGSRDYMVKIWDARTGQESLTLKGHTDAVMSVTFSPDGQRLASGSRDNTVKIWDVQNGQESLTLKGHTNGVASVAFSPDGQRLASGSHDNTVKIWDARTGQESLTLKGHTEAVMCVAFSPDGQRLASGSNDNTVKIWDARTGQECLTLKGHTSAQWVAFSPDGQRLALGSRDNTVKIWDARPLSDESCRERQALCVFRYLAQTLVLKEEIFEGLQRAKTISEPVRAQALAWLEEYRESPYLLNEASSEVVRRADEIRFVYQLALRQAQVAVRLEPNNGLYLNTLGVAQYRLGFFKGTVSTLSKSIELNFRNQPADWAFLAMAQHRLGKKNEAQASLNKLYELLKKPNWAQDAEAQAFLKEAVAVLQELPGKNKENLWFPIPH
jgi:WD40 repeat protein/serine/threonine protein kinase